MKCFICSDIHGSAAAAAAAIGRFQALGCDLFLLLGDILYHGPRNPLPDGHDPAKTADLLNSVSGCAAACRGNCEAEVDQVLLRFPVLCESVLILDGQRRLFMTHGHIWSLEKLPPLPAGSVFLSGHTHIPALEKNKDGIILCNPGSLSLPKGGSQAGYAVYDSGRLELCTLDGCAYKTLVC